MCSCKISKLLETVVSGQLHNVQRQALGSAVHSEWNEPGGASSGAR